MIVYRSKINNIIFEFLSAKKDKGVVIFCDGLPSVPKQKELMVYFSTQGYSVVYPRYRGTWESGGEFLKESPSKDIAAIIREVKKGKLKELYANRAIKINNGNIFLIGSSFGGSIALSLVENKNVSKIVALSPLVDFKIHNNNNNEQDLSQLSSFIKKAFGNAYRFKRENWDKMVKGQIFNPKQKLSKKEAEKILIFFDKSDNSIDYKKIQNYSHKNGLKNIEVKKIGHLSFSKISDKIKVKIVDHLKK